MPYVTVAVPTLILRGKTVVTIYTANSKRAARGQGDLVEPTNPPPARALPPRTDGANWEHTAL